jgi:hypothetical protein
MALQVKHKITPNNSNRNISLTDTTGVYSTSNSTGYGADQVPTGLRETTDVLTANVSILNYNGTLNFTGLSATPTIVDEVYSTSFDNTTAIALANGTSQTIALGTLIPDTYVDAVYKSVYYNWFDATPVMTIAYYNANTISVTNVEDFVNAAYVNIYFSGVYKIYNIVSVDTTYSRVTLLGSVSSMLNTESYTIGYSSTAYFASTYYINKCLHNRVAKLAISSCSCNNSCTEKLYEAVMLFMSIQPNMDLGKYQKAQDIITYLTNYCNDGCCNC